jgi:hypothetical protein
MDAPVDQCPPAWQPLTPRGVGAFARASFGRVFLVQFVVALLVASATVWFLKVAWFPTISEAIERLPPQGTISSGRLVWLGESPELLAESRFLAFAVDLHHAAQARSPAHVQVEFSQTDARFYSLFGSVLVPYPKAYVLAFNSQELKPWWGARAPIFLAVAAGGTVFGLMIGWAALASIYCLPVWLIGLYFNRKLTLCGSWRLAGAALMPGALVATVAIVCYGLGELDLVRFMAAFILHILVGWGYLVLGALTAPKIPGGPNLRVNPFKEVALDSNKFLQQNSGKSGRSNPFRPSGD